MIAKISSKLIARFKKEPFLWSALLVFGIIMLLIPVCNHYFFRTYNFDYAAYNFALYDYAHFKVSPNPISFHENMNFLQDHLSFTFFFFIPLYWMFSWIFGTYTLLIIQSVFIIYGGWAVYRLIDYQTRSKVFAALGLVLYFVSFGRFSSFMMDCNLMIILSSVVPIFLYHFIKGDYKLSIFWFAFLILGRESIPLWMIFICLLLVIMFRKVRVKLKYATWFGVISLIYFILAFKFLIPLVGDDPNRPFSLFNYSALGEGPLEALKFLLSHPIDSIHLLFENHLGDPTYNGVKQEFYITYLVSGGAILLLRPKYFLPLIPIIFQKMFNDSPIRWGIELYYSIEVVTLLPVLVFFTLSELKWKNVAYSLGALTCVGAIIMTLHKMDDGNRSLVGWFKNTKYKFYSRAMYTSKYDHNKLHAYLDSIPDDAKVSASLHITPHLAFRPVIHQFPRVDDADYIVLIKHDDSFPVSREEYDTQYELYLQNKEWSVQYEDHEFILLKRASVVGSRDEN